MNVEIIDRAEEEKNKSYEEAFAGGLGMTIEEVREAREEIKRMKQRREEAEKQGIILEQCPTTDVGKVMFYDDLDKNMKRAFKYENNQN